MTTYIATRTISTTFKGRTTTIKKGERCSAAKREKFSKTMKQYLVPVSSGTGISNRGPALIESELTPILAEYTTTYLDDGSQVGVFDRHTASVGVVKTRHDVIATTMSIHGQLAAIDSKYPGKRSSFNRMGNTLKGMLLAYNEQAGFDRFEVA